MNTLEDWLVRNANNTHSQVYLRWNVRRPTEETRKVIKGILGSLADMHHFGRYHGVLYNSANYILKWAQKHNISRDERYVVKFRQDPNAMYKTTTCAQGQQVDTQAKDENALEVDFGAMDFSMPHLTLSSSIGNELNFV
ncbi:hypothetical protein C3L33_17946, partial [Rhododendron williamsianum]